MIFLILKTVFLGKGSSLLIKTKENVTKSWKTFRTIVIEKYLKKVYVYIIYMTILTCSVVECTYIAAIATIKDFLKL